MEKKILCKTKMSVSNMLTHKLFLHEKYDAF